MEEDYISISTLNDFIFCPYSIYLHNVYENTDDSLYHATPQTQGRIAHEAVDEKKSRTRKDVLQAMPVYSEKYGLMGKIDIYKSKEKYLIERKFQLKQIYQGQIYQLWAQMFCLQEMGYEVKSCYAAGFIQSVREVGESLTFLNEIIYREFVGSMIIISTFAAS